jgi:hypothetical protein
MDKPTRPTQFIARQASSRRSWLIRYSLLALLSLFLLVLPAQAAVLKLNHPLASATDKVEGFRISANNQYVVYRSTTSIYPELYTVPITGGTPVRLASRLPPVDPIFAGPGFYLISPNSLRVVYLGVPSEHDPSDSAKYGLWSAPVDGSTPSVRLDSVPPPNSGVKGFLISPDSQRVAFWGDQEANGVIELYSAPIDGSAAAVKLNKPLAAGGDVLTEAQISPNSSRVIYTADQDTDEVYELYSVPLAGPASAGVKLNSPLVSEGDLGLPPTYSNAFKISPDSARVVYYADQDTDGVSELYSVPIDGSASAIKLNVAGGSIYPGAFQISPDSAQVVYIISQSGGRDVYNAPINGPASAGIKLDDEALLGAAQPDFSYFATNNTVILSGGGNAYRVPANGPAAAAVQLVSGTVFQFISPARNYLITYSGPSAGGSLFSVPISGSISDTVQLNSVPVSGYLGQSISPDNSRLVYLDSNRELNSVPIGGPYTDSVKISGPLVAGGEVMYYSGFSISPNGERVVYRADAEVDNKIELYVTDEGSLLTNKVYLPLVIR